MRRTKDQRDLSEILALAIAARDAAYSLFSRRLDTRRNVNSFICLSDAFNSLNKSCEALEVAIEQATDTRSSSQNSVMDEIMVRSGRATIVQEDGEREEPKVESGTAVILEFPKK